MDDPYRENINSSGEITDPYRKNDNSCREMIDHCGENRNPCRGMDKIGRKESDFLKRN
jgi:hypothetical protein